MDDTSQHLKHLLKQTDIAFKALMNDPGSLNLNEQYEQAKHELDCYTASLKHAITARHQNRQHKR